MNAPTTDWHFVGSWLKLDRAAGHISDLRARVTAFLGAGPYTVVEEPQDGSSEVVFKARVNQPVPPIMGIIVGDIVHNLRSALDLLATDLARANGHTSRTALNKTYFPVSADRENFEASGKAKIQRLSTKAQSLIERIEPFKGGHTEELYNLHHLDIADKHASLVPVAAAYTAWQISFALDADDIVPGEVMILGGTVQVPELIYPLTDNAVLARVPDNKNPRSRAELKSTFSLVFDGLGFVDGRDAIAQVEHFHALVSSIMSMMEIHGLE